MKDLICYLSITFSLILFLIIGSDTDKERIKSLETRCYNLEEETDYLCGELDKAKDTLKAQESRALTLNRSLIQRYNLLNSDNCNTEARVTVLESQLEASTANQDAHNVWAHKLVNYLKKRKCQ